MPKYLINSIIFLILLLSGGMFYLLNRDHGDVQILSKKSFPDSYIVDAIYHRMDNEGQEFALLNADYVEHIPKKNMTTLEKPYLVIHNEENVWRLRANHAQSENEFDSIYLSQNVEISRDETSDKSSLKASTESLLVHPRLQLVETDKTVTIEQPGLKISGHGLLGNLKNGNLKLLKHMQSTLTPTA